MKVIADLCVVPIGVGVSVSKEIAICERILAAAGLKTHLHAYGTNIEGDWDRGHAHECDPGCTRMDPPELSADISDRRIVLTGAASVSCKAGGQ
jgi:hypothetical protein